MNFKGGRKIMLKTSLKKLSRDAERASPSKHSKERHGELSSLILICYVSIL